MAPQIDQTLGQAGVQLGSNTGPRTVSFTTVATTAINARVVVCVGYFSANGFCSSVSIGGTSATRDIRGNWVDGALSPGYVFEVWSLPMLNVLTSGSTISATWSTAFSAGQMTGTFVAAISVVGVSLAVSGSVIATGTFSGAATVGTWNSGIASAPSAGFAVGGAATGVGGGTINGLTTTGTQFAVYNDTTSQDLFDAAYIAVPTSSAVTLAGTISPSGGQSGTGGAIAVYSQLYTPLTYGNYFYQQNR